MHLRSVLNSEATVLVVALAIASAVFGAVVFAIAFNAPPPQH